MRKPGFLPKLLCLLGLIGSLTLFIAMAANANPGGRMLRRSAHSDSVTRFERFEIKIPAGAADREMTVEEVELDHRQYFR